MSARRADVGERPGKKDRKAETPAKPAKGAPAIQYGPPLKPRPKLFLILCVAFGLWVIALIVMYFTTVYHHPHA